MPRRSRRTRKKRSQRSKQFMARSTGLGNVAIYRARPLNGQTYKFRRSFLSAITVTMNGILTESHGAFKFKLNDLPTYAEFTNLFDKYRIVGISARFMPRINMQSITGATVATTATSPPLITVIDYDDATSSDNTVLVQFENARVHYEFKPFKLFFRPKTAVSMYNGTFTGFGTGKNTWVDAASPDVEYYALKWASLPYAAANTTNAYWDVFFNYYIEFKYPR